MPSIKEATVEVEVLEPAPVTKEVTKCDIDSVLKGDNEKEVISKDAAVVDSTESVPAEDKSSGKAQEAEITSSAVEEVSSGKETVDGVKNGKSEEAEATPSEAAVESNGSATVDPVSEVSTSGDSTEAKAEVSKEVTEEPAGTVDSSKTEVSESAPDSVATADSSNEVKKKETVEVKPLEGSEMETNEKLPETEPKEVKTEEDGGAEETTEKEETVDSDASAKVKPLENGDMETDGNSTKSEATEMKKTEEPQDGGSEETAKKEETPSADSTSTTTNTNEKSEAESGPSSTSETDVQVQIDTLKKQGLTHLIQSNFFSAADAFGKVLELQAPLYGEMSEKLAETYYLYGTAMYEYGKSENTVLGEKVKEQEEEEEEEGEEEEAAEGEDKMEVEESTDGGVGSSEKESAEGAAEETLAEEDKEDDDSFRVAWEMLELAKATFQKGNNEKRLADTLMKLGEVGIETGNAEAISEMVASLEVRKKIYPANHRIIPETHFNIGVAFAFFEKYDEAVEHLKESKACLERRIESLANSEAQADVAEVEEMRTILPDIQEKIADTLESKADKEKIKEGQKTEEPVKEESTSSASPFGSSSGDSAKPASNISHLIKRKRNVDDILPERAAKQIRQEPTSSEETKSVAEETKPVAEEAKPVAEETKPVAETTTTEETDKKMETTD